VIPHFDLLDNPAICCSANGGVICDESLEINNPSAKDPSYKLLKTHALYTKDLELKKENSIMSINDKNNFNVEGVFYSLFLVCSPGHKNNTENLEFEDYSKVIYLNGDFSFFNSFGFLSAEEFHSVDIYLFLSLFYFLLSLYWVYKLIIKNSGFKKYAKLLTFILPIIILEKMMNLQIYSEINKWGELNVAFETLSIICNVLKNFSFRIILYGISIGYGYTVQDFKQISRKKIFNFSLLIFGYVASLIVFLIIYSRYTF
jgi:hypothetical protein